jgi:Family of unknown function (DUF5330)
MFLIRTGFWLIVLILLLPTNEQQQSEVFGTAQAAVKDVSGFCDRNPSVCEMGKDAFDVFVQKAQFGGEMLMAFIKERTGMASDSAVATPGGGDNAAPADPVTEHSSLDKSSAADVGSWSTAPVTVDPVSADGDNSQDTLSTEDLGPEWAGPESAGT